MTTPAIIPYEERHWHLLFAALEQEPEWESFTAPTQRDRYRHMLQDSLTMVCCRNQDFCGFVRAITDHEMAVYVSELYVRPVWRNRGIGQDLLLAVKSRSKGKMVYVLSDVNDYYLKKGYRKAGSVFLL